MTSGSGTFDMGTLLSKVPESQIPEVLSSLIAMFGQKSEFSSSSAPAAPGNVAAGQNNLQLAVSASALQLFSASKDTRAPALRGHLSAPPSRPAGIQKPRRKKNAPRRHWSTELHGHFVNAWQVIAATGCVPSPKKIMIIMRENGAAMEDLTIRQVQSHHQKYKLKLQQEKEQLAGSDSQGWHIGRSVSLDSVGSDLSGPGSDDDSNAYGAAVSSSLSIDSVASDWSDVADSWTDAMTSDILSTTSPLLPYNHAAAYRARSDSVSSDLGDTLALARSTSSELSPPGTVDFSSEFSPSLFGNAPLTASSLGMSASGLGMSASGLGLSASDLGALTASGGWTLPNLTNSGGLSTSGGYSGWSRPLYRSSTLMLSNSLMQPAELPPPEETLQQYSDLEGAAPGSNDSSSAVLNLQHQSQYDFADLHLLQKVLDPSLIDEMLSARCE